MTFSKVCALLRVCISPKSLRKSVQELSIGTVKKECLGFPLYEPLHEQFKTNAFQSDQYYRSMDFVVSAVQGRDPHSEFNLHEISGLLTVTIIMDMQMAKPSSQGCTTSPLEAEIES